jgi:hypothetical protein
MDTSLPEKSNTMTDMEGVVLAPKRSFFPKIQQHFAAEFDSRLQARTKARESRQMLDEHEETKKSRENWLNAHKSITPKYLSSALFPCAIYPLDGFFDRALPAPGKTFPMKLNIKTGQDDPDAVEMTISRYEAGAFRSCLNRLCSEFRDKYNIKVEFNEQQNKFCPSNLPQLVKHNQCWPQKTKYWPQELLKVGRLIFLYSSEHKEKLNELHLVCVAKCLREDGRCCVKVESAFFCDGFVPDSSGKEPLKQRENRGYKKVKYNHTALVGSPDVFQGVIDSLIEWTQKNPGEDPSGGYINFGNEDPEAQYDDRKTVALPPRGSVSADSAWWKLETHSDEFIAFYLRLLFIVNAELALTAELSPFILDMDKLYFLHVDGDRKKVSAERKTNVLGNPQFHLFANLMSYIFGGMARKFCMESDEPISQHTHCDTDFYKCLQNRNNPFDADNLTLPCSFVLEGESLLHIQGIRSRKFSRPVVLITCLRL